MKKSERSRNLRRNSEIWEEIQKCEKKFRNLTRNSEIREELQKSEKISWYQRRTHAIQVTLYKYKSIKLYKWIISKSSMYKPNKICRSPWKYCCVVYVRMIPRASSSFFWNLVGHCFIISDVKYLRLQCPFYLTSNI